jgi:outer membrane biosynthesis protein TonB
MYNTIHMNDTNFESRKNIKAGSLTLMVLGLLLFVLLVVAWSAPINNQLPPEEGMEVNLGNSDAGMGVDQPFEPTPPAPQDQQQYTPPKAEPAKEEPVKDPETDDKDPDAPDITKPRVTKPDAKKVAEKEIIPNKPVKNPQPIINPTPAPPKPKALFKGTNGTGTGGNDADTYKKGGNQGIAGGKGDQGKPGGDPNSGNYTGGGRGTGGVSVSRGLQGRSIIRTPSFEDEFNENAKVAVDIKVDASGNVVSATYQPRGSTTSDASMKDIARRKALQVKFNTGAEESAGTLIFNFKLKN